MIASEFLLGNGADADVAIIEGETRTTYGALARMSGQVRGALSGLDLPPGSRVGIHGPNSAFWVAGYLAIMDMGLVAVPFPTNATGEEFRRGAHRVGIRAILSQRPSVPDVGVPVIGPTDLGDHSDAPARRQVDPDDDALLLFTSGSTGQPRAVRITHGNIRANTESIVEYLALGRTDRMLVVLPFAYSFGASLLHTHLSVGGSLVLVNSFAYPERALDVLERTACTGMAGVPSTFHMLLRNSTFAQRALPQLRLIQQAGGKLPAQLVDELLAAQPQARVFIMYGQTEATARLSYLAPELAAVKRGSVGRGIPGVELVVRAEDGRPVAPAQMGEIWASGANISPGYFDDPEATAAKFHDGALRTGDMATVDDDGFIYIVDRVADFIKSWGFRISSQEVESAALRLPEVVAAAAIGVEDPSAGERVELFAVVRPGSGLTAADILAECRRTLPRHKLPEHVHLLDSLPLNANGKVSKPALRERAEQGRLRIA